jgi:uncharacterized damage-inducible protein DinB
MRHAQWADALVWRAVLAHPAAASDGALLDKLHHVHEVQHLFRQGWIGGGFERHDRAELRSAVALARWAHDGHRHIEHYLAAAAPGDLARELRLPWVAHFERARGVAAAPHTVAESMLQVALHTAHHRGQAATRLRELGGEPPQIDFIVWLWSARPAPEWAFLELGARPAR